MVYGLEPINKKVDPVINGKIIKQLLEKVLVILANIFNGIVRTGHIANGRLLKLC